MYNLYYTCDFTNRLNEYIEVSLQKNAAAPVSVETIPVVDCKLSYQRADEDSCIFNQELTITLFIDQSSTVDWTTFLVSNYDEWKIFVNWGTRSYVGFLVPENGGVPFRDKPYEITLKFTDGLGLLKGYNYNLGAGFKTLKDVIVNCLSFTGLDFNIKAYSNLLHAAMLNKGDGPQYDHFNQAYINARTLLKDSNSYETAYDVLRLIFDEHYIIFQDSGDWVLWPKMNYLREDSRYWVRYDATGTVVDTGLDAPNNQPFGPDELIYPQYEDQILSSKFANKSVKHQFDYIVPEDLVNNQKLQQLGALIVPLSGSGYSAYQLSGWTHYKGQPQTGLPTSQTPSSETAYIKVEYDAFNQQTDRYYVVPQDVTAPSTQLENYIRNNNIDFFVDKDDKLDISIMVRTKFDENTTDLFLASLIILKDGASGSSAGDWYSLDDSGSWINSPNSVFAKYNITADTTEWKTISLSELNIPANGVAYLLLGHGDLVVSANEAHFKEINISYTTYIRGARFNLKGDYNKRTQTANFPDISEKTVRISDSPKRLIKGGLWRTTTQLFGPEWYYIGYSGTLKGYKEWINYLKYNLTRLRFYSLQGSFSGTQIRLTDKIYSVQMNKNFMPDLPLEIDLCEGSTNFVMIELPSTESNSDDPKFDYIF